MNKLIAAMVTGLFLAGTAWVSPLRAQETKIGVLRFTDAVNAYARTKDIQTETMAKLDALRKEDTDKRDEINRLTAKLQQATPGSEAYGQTEKEVEAKKAEYDTWSRMKNQELINDEANMLRDIFHDIEQATQEYGRANRYTLIIKKDDLDLLRVRADDLKLKLALRKVLYFDPAADVTDGVVKLLNEGYTAKKK